MSPNSAGSLIPTIGAVEPRPRSEFLGEELGTEARVEGPWWLRAILSGPPPEEIPDSGELPSRPTGVLPLRHGVTAAGLPARCLLDSPEQLLTLRAVARTGAVRAPPAHADGRECAACAAWIAQLRARNAPPAEPGPIEFVREVFERLVA